MVRGRPAPRAGPIAAVHRLRVESLLDATAELRLPDAEAHHLRVRRAESGDRAELLDGAGAVATGTLQLAGRDWVARIERIDRYPAPPPVILLVGSGDKDRFGWLIEKAAEIGATRVVAVETERGRTVSTRVRESHLERLQRRADEALKQCGGSWGMIVGPVVSLAEAIEFATPDRRWLADREGGSSSQIMHGTGTVMVGPEGGLTAEERSLLLGQGFAPVRLGPHTLRFETAAIAAALLTRLPREDGR